MEIYLPKSNTDSSQTGGSSKWEATERGSQTQRQALVTFEMYLSKLSAKTKEIDEKVQEIENIKTKANNLLKRVKSMEYLLIFGFLVLSVMVAGVVISYVEFVYSGSKNDDYKYNLSEKVNNNNNSIKMLKNCLDSNRWLNPKCLEN
jgi:hypothetical protein